MKHKISVKELCQRVLKVASLPEVFIKIDEAINNPYSSSDMLAEILMEDPALAAKLLRLANSAFYGFSSKVETITKAITIIGTQQLKDLVLACSVLKIFKDVPEDMFNMQEFWKHSIACGLAARNLAIMKRENNTERFFVAGLLHDIGRLILLMEKPNETQQVIADCHAQAGLLSEYETKMFGYDHSRVGSMLLHLWKLSDRLVEQVQYHHEPAKASRYNEDVVVVHVANLIANAMHYGTSGDLYISQLNADAWDSLKMDVGEIPNIIEQIDLEFDDAVSFILGN